MDIRQRIFEITEQISAINKDVELVAATKTRSLEEVKEAFSTLKVTAAGENRVQELLSKYDGSIPWDFIGQLQTNKVKYILGKVRLIHSVDRISLAQAIEKEGAKQNLVQDVLIQINTGKEESKGGIIIEEAAEFYSALREYPHLRVRGMMAVTPIYYNQEESLRAFKRVYATYGQLKSDTFTYLSMGMSNDYLAAVQAGANLIRLGRAIFGERGENNG